jgi:hypothetical protein
MKESPDGKSDLQNGFTGAKKVLGVLVGLLTGYACFPTAKWWLPAASDRQVGGGPILASELLAPSEQTPPTPFQNLGSEMGLDGLFGHVRMDQRGRNGDCEIHDGMHWLAATRRLYEDIAMSRFYEADCRSKATRI